MCLHLSGNKICSVCSERTAGALWQLLGSVPTGISLAGGLAYCERQGYLPREQWACMTTHSTGHPQLSKMESDSLNLETQFSLCLQPAACSTAAHTVQQLAEGKACKLPAGGNLKHVAVDFLLNGIWL